MYDVIVIAVVVLLLANLIAAFLATARRRVPDRWLLAVLLSGTTGAAVVALFTVLMDDGDARFLDVAVVLIGLTALTAGLRVTAARRAAAPGQPAGASEDGPA